jgi:hypothetical protein
MHAAAPAAGRATYTSQLQPFTSFLPPLKKSARGLAFCCEDRVGTLRFASSRMFSWQSRASAGARVAFLFSGSKRMHRTVRAFFWWTSSQWFS